MATLLFPLQVLVLAIIFLLIGICIPFPYPGDNVSLMDCKGLHFPHFVVVNSTDGSVINCFKCDHKCPPGEGLKLPCDGGQVTHADMQFCVPCVAGVNYSTSETFQCQPCLSKRCMEGEVMHGKCEREGDRRTCKTSTREMTTIIMPFFPNNDGRSGVWDDVYTIIVVCGILVLLVLYICCVRLRAKKLQLDHPRLSVCSKEWFCPVFFFKEATRSRPPSYTIEDRHANKNGCGEQQVFIRQNSCPVTQNEICLVNRSPHACLRKKLGFLDMNSETCRKISQALLQLDSVGMGYTTLAGYMDFTANDVKNFELHDNPAKVMLECWSKSNKFDGVLKLKDLVAKLKRDDISELIKVELEGVRKKCPCLDCVSVSP